jgi:hypothetical protein
MGIGDWGLGIVDLGFGVWGWGFGGLGDWPTPQSPIPNPQSPIPMIYQTIKYFLINKLIVNLNNFIAHIKIKYIFFK